MRARVGVVGQGGVGVEAGIAPDVPPAGTPALPGLHEPWWEGAFEGGQSLAICPAVLLWLGGYQIRRRGSCQSRGGRLGQDFLSSYRQVLSPTDHLLLPVMVAETADAHATASVAPSAEGILAGAPQDLPQEAVDWLNLGLWMVR